MVCNKEGIQETHMAAIFVVGLCLLLGWLAGWLLLTPKFHSTSVLLFIHPSVHPLGIYQNDGILRAAITEINK